MVEQRPRREIRTPGRRSSTETAATPATTAPRTWRFNEFTGGATDANFENGDPTKWVIISAPLANSGEAVGFYWPQVADPNPPTGAHPIFSGLQHVWRSWAFGAGANPTAVPQNTTPDIANYEANCPEFTEVSTRRVAATSSRWAARRARTIGDLTGSVYGQTAPAERFPGSRGTRPTTEHCGH